MRPLLLQHLDSEDLAEAIIGRSISWQEDDLTKLHETLFNTPCQHITDTFNLADSRGGHAHVCTDWALRHAAGIIEDVIERVHVHLCAIDINIDAIPMELQLSGYAQLTTQIQWNFESLVMHH